MLQRIVILISCGLFISSISAQCPDRKGLIKRMSYLRDSSRLPVKEQQAELLSILKNINSCSFKNDSTHIFLLRRIGGNYYHQADYLKAAEYYQEAIKIMTENAGKQNINPAEKILSYYWLSVVYNLLNNVQKKMEAADSCIAIAMRLNRPSDISCVRSLYAKVEYFYDKGDYYRCIDYATRCGALAKEYADNVIDQAYKMAGITISESSLGWKVKALLTIKDYGSAEKLLINKVEEYQKTGLINYMGNASMQLAEVQLQKGNYEKALFFFNQSLKYDKDAGYDYNCKQTLKDIGYKIYFRHFKSGDKALVNYRKALKYINKHAYWNTADAFESLNIFTHIANVYVSKGLYDSAWHNFQLAFDQIKPGIDESGILQSSPEEFIKNKKIFYLADLLISKGDAYRKLYDDRKQMGALTKAILIYKEADLLLDRIKAEQSELESKLFWRRDSRRLYEQAIDACYLQGNTADAFYFFEKSRAVLLNDQLNEQRWMGENDILKQTQLKRKILRLERELSSTSSSADHYTSLNAEIFTAKQELDRLEQLIKAGNPLYYQSFLDTGFITLQDVQQKLLKQHHALLEIFSGDSAVYALLVTGKNSYLTKINKQDFEATVGKYISYISNAELLNREFKGFLSVSNHLYKLLFQNSTLPGHRIIISPDGQYFPFEALVTGIINQQPSYFLNDHAVSYTYSARFLMNDFKVGSTTSGRNFMGVAPVTYPSAFSLSALPGSDLSLIKIADYFDNAVNRSASHATRNNFMQQFSQYRIIQLYTHAADSSSNNEPVIYFADSALYLSDLINEYKPLTRLIVLSACETGTGKIYQGEGVFSFNRGFAALGIPAAITNLWSVDDGSTYLLTELFYKWLARGLPTDVALQKAKLEFLQNASGEKSLPCYWAGPVLVGKTDTIELNKSYPWKWIILFLAFGCIVFFAARKWAISKKMADRMRGKKIL